MKIYIIEAIKARAMKFDDKRVYYLEFASFTFENRLILKTYYILYLNIYFWYV